MSRSEVWFVRPRDPLVLGDGRGPIPFFARRAWPLPLPQTVAGMVRAQFVRAGHDVDRSDALALLRDVSIEGPWLADKTAPWVFAPADARRDDTDHLHRDRLIDVGAGEGVFWPAGFAPPAVVAPQAKTQDGHKTRAASPFWPLADAIAWALDLDPPTVDPGVNVPVRGERRVHVKIEDESGTADPGMLFSSAGGRFAEDFGLLLRVTAPLFDGPAGPRWPGERDVVVLGGESRPSFRERLPQDAYPSYEQHRERYEGALARVSLSTGLRLQLVTHACLHQTGSAVGALACLPWWLAGGEGVHPLVPGLRLRLRALRLQRPIAVSGWDLQGGKQRSREGAPRQVRRLVPAGTVYYFDLVGVPEAELGQELARACEGLFAAPLDPAQGTAGGDDEHHLSHPAQDGMGLCLPGLFSGGSR